jgi:hypothetical protein
MIIEHGERMAAAMAQGEVPFKVHLPQFVGGRVFEAPGRSASTGRRFASQQVMAP